MPTDFYLKEYRTFLDDLRDKTADLYIIGKSHSL